MRGWREHLVRRHSLSGSRNSDGANHGWLIYESPSGAHLARPSSSSLDVPWAAKRVGWPELSLVWSSCRAPSRSAGPRSPPGGCRQARLQHLRELVGASRLAFAAILITSTATRHSQSAREGLVLVSRAALRSRATSHSARFRVHLSNLRPAWQESADHLNWSALPAPPRSRLYSFQLILSDASRGAALIASPASDRLVAPVDRPELRPPACAALCLSLCRTRYVSWSS